MTSSPRGYIPLPTKPERPSGIQIMSAERPTRGLYEFHSSREGHPLVEAFQTGWTALVAKLIQRGGE